MLGLLAITLFHGFSMMPFWEQWISGIAQLIGDSGRLLWSFSIGFAVIVGSLVLLYVLAVGASHSAVRNPNGPELPLPAHV